MFRNVVLKMSYLAVLVSLMILTAEPLRACLIPMFRYGLEAWSTEDYELIVFHNGPVSEEDSLIIKILSELKLSAHANFTLHIVDSSGKISVQYQNLLKSVKAPELPLLVVKYPPKTKSYKGSIWSGPLSEDVIRKTMDSPARQEIVKRILGGDTAVLVLVESGDPTKDDAAAKVILEELSVINKELTLSPELINIAEVCNLDAHIHFSLIRVSRNDPAEEVFIDMLMYTEPGLLEVKLSPIVFLIFARGRALTPMVGKGIKEKFIREGCEFVIDSWGEDEPENLGVGLLIAADWKSGIGKRWVDEEITLVGSTTLISIAKSDETSDLTTSTSVNYNSEVNTTSNRLLRNIIITILSILVVVIGITLFLRPGKRRKITGKKGKIK